VELSACGSSSRNMSSYGEWERIVLEHTFDHVEFISLHTYLNNWAGDTAAFLASPDLMDRFIEEVVAIADAVAAGRRSSKRIQLSFDEWNVWYRTRGRNPTGITPGWPVAPHILEDVYTMEDALAFGGACISLLNHADRVKSACLAQLVNAIAPIMTEPGGPAWRQTIFHPFAQMSRHGRGRVLRAEVDVPTYDTNYCDPLGATPVHFRLPAVPYLKLAAVQDPAHGEVTLFALNRDLDQRMALDASLAGFGPIRLVEAFELADGDLRATNTREQPDRIAPRPLRRVEVEGERLRATLAPASWNVVRVTPVA
jgi:alpha-N-arabinofuranosidase